MLFGGLSERWLLKQSGDSHWNLVCRDLQTPSVELVDLEDERLYASFMRVRIETPGDLLDFRESERLRLAAQVSRFGTKRYYSSLLYQSAEHEQTIRCWMGTVFTTRETDNKSLARARPKYLDASACHVHAVVPPLGQGYQRLKDVSLNGAASTDPLLRLGSEDFRGQPGRVFEMEYFINPYHDLNGVNLLYFASYPRIHDVCERVYFQRLALEYGIREDWALSSSVQARDVFYYGNADIGDRLLFRIVSLDRTSEPGVKVQSALFLGDGTRMADIFTVKRLTPSAAGYRDWWASNG
jgi:probable biosynthetic protein (TIGR04098 family)